MYLYEKNNLNHFIKNPTIPDIKIDTVELEREKERALHHTNHHYITMMSSMAHTYGNVLAYMQKYILELFPEGLFKTIHTHSKLAHRQMKSTNHEFLKKQRPMIIFRPRIAGRDEDRFLKGTALIEPQSDVFSTWGNPALRDFLTDPKNEFRVKYQQNRSVMYIDVIIIFSTLMQQINYIHYLENRVRWDAPRLEPTCLESFIPQEMLSLISRIINVPMYDPCDGNTKEFLTYLQGISCYPITFMFDGATGTREFFRYNKSNVEITFSNLDWDDGEQVDQIMEKYQITFSTRVEFYSTGFYFLYHDKIYDLPMPHVEPESSDLIPIFTDVFTKEDLNLRQGWQLYNRASCKLGDPNDKICIKELMNESILTAIRFYMANGLPMSEFLDFRIRRQGKLIHEGPDYLLNRDTLEVQFRNQNINYTYQFIICINLQLVNAINGSLIEQSYQRDKIVR